MSDKDKPDVEIIASEVYIKQEAQAGMLKFIKSVQGSKGRFKHGGTTIEIKSETVYLTPEEARTLPEKELLQNIQQFESYAAQQRPRRDIERKAVQNLQAACVFVRAAWPSAEKNPFDFAQSVLAASEAKRIVEKLATEQAVATGKRMRKQTASSQEEKEKACIAVKNLLSSNSTLSLQQACKAVEINFKYSFKTIERECKKRGMTGAIAKKGRKEMKK